MKRLTWFQDDIVPKPFHIPELMQKTDQLMASRTLGHREGQTDYFMKL